MANISGLRNLLQNQGKKDQTLQGNGATPPPVTRDAPSVASKEQVSAARKQAIANLTPNGAANSSSRRAMRNVRGAEQLSQPRTKREAYLNAQDAVRSKDFLGTGKNGVNPDQLAPVQQKRGGNSGKKPF